MFDLRMKQIFYIESFVRMLYFNIDKQNKDEASELKNRIIAKFDGNIECICYAFYFLGTLNNEHNL